MQFSSNRNKIDKLYKNESDVKIDLEINSDKITTIFKAETHKYLSHVLYDSGWVVDSSQFIMGG